MDQLKAMTVFVRCVERGSLSAAAAEFMTTQPSISKLIAGLEARLAGALLVRSTRGVRLTPQGQRYYEDCKAIVDAVARANEGFGQAKDAVAGSVRIAASQAFGRIKVVPGMATLMRRYPELRVNLNLNDHRVDLVAEGVDVAFRFGRMEDSALLARRVGVSRRILVASPDYMLERGPIRAPAGLEQHDCIGLDIGPSGQVWSLSTAVTEAGRPAETIKVAVHGRLQTDSPESAREAALAGMGVSAISEWMVGEDLRAKRLIHVLPAYALTTVPIHLVMPRSSRHLARVRAVAEYFEQQFGHDREIRLRADRSESRS